jgi:hypothetical protein
MNYCIHPSKIIIPILLSSLVSGCGLIPGKSDRKAAYREGYIDGGANERKRQYWANQNEATSPLPPVTPVALQAVVPEHTEPDGVIIQEHTVEETPESVSP